MGEIIKGRVHLIFPLPPEKNTPKHKLNECPTCFNLDSIKDKMRVLKYYNYRVIPLMLR